MTTIQPCKKVALFLDGPNIIRKAFRKPLESVEEAASEYGTILIKRAYLDKKAKLELIQAVINAGYEPIVNTYSDDVDTFLVSDAVETICTREDIDLIAIATRDADVLPVLYKARSHKKETLIIAPTSGLSIALQKSATYYKELENT